MEFTIAFSALKYKLFIQTQDANYLLKLKYFKNIINIRAKWKEHRRDEPVLFNLHNNEPFLYVGRDMKTKGVLFK